MKFRACLSGILILLVSLTAGDLYGQRRERDREGGGRGGFGRGTMGMGRGQQNLFSLAANPAVQKELALKEEQVKGIAKITEDYFAEIRSVVSFDPAGFQDASPEERAKLRVEMMEKMASANKAATEKLKPELAKTLDEKQMARLHQIYLQSLRGDALSQDDVVSALKIADDQKEKIAKTKKDFDDKVTALMNPDADGDPMDRFAKIRELGEDRDKALFALLSEDQAKEFEKLKGDVFDLGQLRGGLGGRRGEGRGLGGGRGGEGGRPQGSGRPQRQAESTEKSDSKSDSDASK